MRPIDSPIQPPRRGNRLRSRLGLDFSAGQWGEVRVRVGWSLPVLVLALLLGGWFFRDRPGNGDLPVLAGILSGAFVGGAIFQGLVRVWLVKLFGGQPVDLTLRALGTCGTAIATPKARMILAMSVPVVTLAAACGLAAMPPHGEGWRGVSLVPPELTGQLTAASVMVACTWVLVVQAAGQALPLPGCHGRELLIAGIDLVAERLPQLRRKAAIRLALGITSIVWMKCALVVFLFRADADVPYWPLFLGIGVACWLSRHAPLPPPPPDMVHRQRALLGSWEDEPKPPGVLQPRAWWKHRRLQRRLQLSRRAELQEAEDARLLDAILQKMHDHGRDALTSAERGVLERVSHRLRDTRGSDAAAANDSR